jgi:hypothetical protein
MHQLFIGKDEQFVLSINFYVTLHRLRHRQALWYNMQSTTFALSYQVRLVIWGGFIFNSLSLLFY